MSRAGGTDAAGAAGPNRLRSGPRTCAREEGRRLRSKGGVADRSDADTTGTDEHEPRPGAFASTRVVAIDSPQV